MKKNSNGFTMEDLDNAYVRGIEYGKRQAQAERLWRLQEPHQVKVERLRAIQRLQETHQAEVGACKLMLEVLRMAQ